MTLAVMGSRARKPSIRITMPVSVWVISTVYSATPCLILLIGVGLSHPSRLYSLAAGSMRAKTFLATRENCALITAHNAVSSTGFSTTVGDPKPRLKYEQQWRRAAAVRSVFLLGSTAESSGWLQAGLAQWSRMLLLGSDCNFLIPPRFIACATASKSL